MAVQATTDEVYAILKNGDEIFLRTKHGDVYTNILLGSKNRFAISPVGVFKEGDHVFRMDEVSLCPQLIGVCENVLETCCVPPNNAMLTAKMSLIKLRPGFQVENRLILVCDNENKSFPLEIYRGTISPKTQVIIHGEIPRVGCVVKNPYSDKEQNLFQVILVSDLDPGRHPVEEPLFITSVPQKGSVSLDMYGMIAGMVGNYYAFAPLYPCLYYMYGSSLGSFDSGFTSL